MSSSELRDRVLRLERENRLIKRLLVALAAALGLFPLLALAGDETPQDAHHRIVYASKFALQDPRTGKLRAQLAHQVQEGGWAGITLWDEAGQPRAELKLWEDGRTHLRMMDAERRELTRLSVSAEGEPELVLGGRTVKID